MSSKLVVVVRNVQIVPQGGPTKQLKMYGSVGTQCCTVIFVSINHAKFDKLVHGHSCSLFDDITLRQIPLPDEGCSVGIGVNALMLPYGESLHITLDVAL